MKIKRILALLLAIVMVVGLFAGCDKDKDNKDPETETTAPVEEVKDAVSKEDIEKDPKAALEEALKKSLSKSPLKDLPEFTAGEATGIEVVIDAAETGKISADLVFANEKLCALLGLNVAVDGETISGEIFVDEENFAIKSELLAQMFETDALGVSLKDFEKNFKESAWYDLLFVQSGLEEELANSEAASIDVQAIVDAYVKYLESLTKLQDGYQKYAVEEVTVKIGDEEVKCYKVVETLDPKLAEAVETIFKDFMNDVSAAVNEPIEDADMDEVFGEMKTMIEEIAKIYSVDYIIERKTGALLKIESEMELDAESLIPDGMAVEETEATKLDYKFEINFGEKPTKTFAPTFKMEVNDGSMKTIVDGKAGIDAEAKAFVVEATFETKSTDGTDEFDNKFNLKFSVNKDETWQIKAWAEENEIVIGGQFKIEDTKLWITIDMEELSEGEIKAIELTIDLDAKIPTVFEYDDMMKWSEEQVVGFVEMLNMLFGSSYDDGYDDGMGGIDGPIYESPESPVVPEIDTAA